MVSSVDFAVSFPSFTIHFFPLFHGSKCYNQHKDPCSCTRYLNLLYTRPRLLHYRLSDWFTHSVFQELNKLLLPNMEMACDEFIELFRREDKGFTKTA